MKTVWSSICLILLLQWKLFNSAEVNPPANSPASCKDILARSPNSASGVYTIKTEKTKNSIEVYCEMGLNGGGYTFISSKYLQWILNSDVQAMFTDRTSFLLRFKTCRSTQPYIVLKQLSQYGHINLKIGLNEHSDYAGPQNIGRLGSPYLYFGFLPIANAANNNVQGVSANGNEYTFTNGDANPNSYFALFANYKENNPINYPLDSEWTFWNQVLDSAKINPSKREMPVEYFYFMEAHFGGGGVYTQTDSGLDKKCIESSAIGFR